MCASHYSYLAQVWHAAHLVNPEVLAAGDIDARYVAA